MFEKINDKLGLAYKQTGGLLDVAVENGAIDYQDQLDKRREVVINGLGRSYLCQEHSDQLLILHAGWLGPSDHPFSQAQIGMFGYFYPNADILWIDQPGFGSDYRGSCDFDDYATFIYEKISNEISHRKLIELIG